MFKTLAVAAVIAMIVILGLVFSGILTETEYVVGTPLPTYTPAQPVVQIVTATFAPSATNTLAPSATSTNTPTNTSVPTNTLAPSATPRPVTATSTNTLNPGLLMVNSPVQRQATLAPSATPVPPTATQSVQPEEWQVVYVGMTHPAFEPTTVDVNGEEWELALLAYKASFFDVNGYHLGIAPAPFGPQADGTDAGWCRATVSETQPGQPDCLNRVGLWQVMVKQSDITCIGPNSGIEVGTRLLIENTCDREIVVRIGWRSYSDVLRTGDETTTYVQDYLAGIATRDNPDPSATMHLAVTFSTYQAGDETFTLTNLSNNNVYPAGGGCWNCGGHNTTSDSVAVLPLDEAGYEGPEFHGVDGEGSMVSFIVPRPEETQDFVLRTSATIHAQTSIVVILGQIDVVPPCLVTGNGNIRQFPDATSNKVGDITGSQEAVAQATDSAGYLWYKVGINQWVRSDVVVETEATPGACADLPVENPTQAG